MVQIGSKPIGQKHKKERQSDKRGYNSTWHDKHSLSLGAQTWHGAHKHMEDSIKHVENIDPSTQACGNIDLNIQAQKHACEDVET